jgi:tRNA threonylcarbamoyladenosine biosynthesis protein TsaE
MAALLRTASSDETREVGRWIGKWVKAGDVLALFGDLGTGKTVLVKGLSESLGIKENVESPSFTIISEYQGRIPLYHIDLFRMSSVDEILKIGYEEYVYGDGICAIEWAENIQALLPKRRLDIKLFHAGMDERRIEIHPCGMAMPPLPPQFLQNNGV